MIRWARVLVLGAAMAALLGCQPRTIRPPLVGGETDQVALADPGVLVVGTRTYVAGTTRAPHNVPMLRSDPGTHTFTSMGDALPDPPAWARTRGEEGGSFWAPSLARVQGKYLLYFTARHRDVRADRAGWCVGVAVASGPSGPYTPNEAPLFCSPPPLVSRGVLTARPAENRGAIDPQVYRQGTRHYLHFKALDHYWQLWGVELSADGLSVVGQARGLLAMSSKAQEWEYSDRERFTVLENPSMDYNASGIRGGRFYLYYSGNDWRSDDYATGIAACRTPMGPCLRATNPPWLVRRGEVTGPGDLTIARDLTGQRWAFHHTWSETDARRRVLHVEPLTYDGITPVFQQRRPDGAIEIIQPDPDEPSIVQVRGALADPDRLGTEVGYRITVDGVRVLQKYTRDGSIDRTLTEQYGTHTICVTVRDDTLSGWPDLSCAAVDGGPPPPESTPAPPPTTAVPSQPGPTTTGSTQPATIPSTTVPPSTTLPPGTE